MARNRITNAQEILDLKSKGFNQTEIARIIGVTKSAISWHLRNAGVPPEKNLAAKLQDFLPWEITGDMVNAAPYRCSLYHLEYRETGGREMSAEKLRKLRGFYKQLTDFGSVVRYDPKIPPRPGQRFGGFEYVAREGTDEDLIIRVDEHTKIPADSRAVWRIPPKEDWPG